MAELHTKTILDTIAEYTRGRVEQAKGTVPLEEIRRRAYELPKGSLSFEKALKKDGLSFICECKKASPSKGVIAEDFPYLEIAKQYEEAGADCVSVLSEPKWFLGSDEYVREIAQEIRIPVIRKDFTVDEYMLYEAKLLSASAVLLIVAILEPETLEKYLGICDELGLSALVETHNENEVRTALDAGARVIGVNNRDLRDFSVDTTLSVRMRDLIPRDLVFVSESGIKDAHDIEEVSRAGADAVLVGGVLMRAADKKKKLSELRSAAV